jgi:hypothetical protein
MMTGLLAELSLATGALRQTGTIGGLQPDGTRTVFNWAIPMRRALPCLI